MTSEEGLTKDDFLRMAQAAGLDTSDAAHMEELYPYIRTVLLGFQPLRDLDLKDVEPAMVHLPERE